MKEECNGALRGPRQRFDITRDKQRRNDGSENESEDATVSRREAYRRSIALIVAMKTSPSMVRLLALILSIVSSAVWW
jgi:hypothetical protein